MAREVIEQIVDDVTGEVLTADEAQTVTIAVDGAEWTLDGSQETVDKFHEAIAPYLDAATPVRKQGRGRPAKVATISTEGTRLRNKMIREWAAEQGIEVPARGRISKDVQDKYDAAKSA